jgi:16S rRNA G966 N2-methylase RsmD
MLKENYTKEEKVEIASHIKNISFEEMDEEMERLMEIGIDAHSISERSRIGNNVVDYFTFVQRLETKGKYNVSFFEFLANIETFREKKFIQNMLKYYQEVKNKNNTKHEHKVLKEVYNICVSAINIMRPLNCMEIYTKYNSKRVLNFCAGWGGSTIASCVLNVDAYYGIEINTDLKEPYNQLINYLKPKCKTEFQMYFEDAASFDYSMIDYDTVFTSPPYYFIEKYANNVHYKTKKEMDEQFYIPVFTNTYTYLKPGGHYIINICKEVYDNVLKPLLGEAHTTFPLKKSKRQNNHTEMIYVWKK